MAPRDPHPKKAWPPPAPAESSPLPVQGLLAALVVFGNQHFPGEDAWVGQPPRDDCCRKGLTLENRLVAPCTGPRLTHVVPLPNQPILPLGRGRGSRRD